MRLWAKLAVVAGVVVAGLLAYDCCFGILWVGSFPLQVSLVPSGDREITQVSVQALMLKKWADDLHTDPRRLDLDLRPEAVDKPFTVRVTSSGSRSGFGRELSYFQYELLVLRVEYADGTSEYVTAEIPDGRRQREMSVQLP